MCRQANSVSPDVVFAACNVAGDGTVSGAECMRLFGALWKAVNVRDWRKVATARVDDDEVCAEARVS